MSATCGAYKWGKTPCASPSVEMAFDFLPLCKSHRASLHEKMRIERYKGQNEARDMYIDTRILESQDKRDSSIVYFVRAGRRVKIGHSRNPENRLKTIRSGSCKHPAGLDMSNARIVATEPGGQAREYQLHQQFAHLREAGEWFRGSPELTEYIKQLAA